MVTMAMCRASPHSKGDWQIHLPWNYKEGECGVGEGGGEAHIQAAWLMEPRPPGTIMEPCDVSSPKEISNNVLY